MRSGVAALQRVPEALKTLDRMADAAYWDSAYARAAAEGRSVEWFVGPEGVADLVPVGSALSRGGG